MSINKKALTRYLAYDRCLRNRGRKYTWKDLLNAANASLAEEGLDGIGKTQFYADMLYLELGEWKAPIEKNKDGRTVYFRYGDPSYSINNQPLNETEMHQIKAALRVMARFQGVPQFEWMNEILPAIETKLGLVSVDKQVISFDWNADYEGIHFITPIFNAIVHKRALIIEYQDFKSVVAYSLEFHPSYLKQFNNRWFAFGWNATFAIPYWNIALDRIKRLEESEKVYVEQDIDWEAYFYDFVGVTKIATDAPIEIRLLFSLNTAPYISTKPLHPSQKRVKHDEKGLEIAINVIPNYELETLILSFGESVKVLSPLKFKEKIVARLHQAISQY